MEITMANDRARRRRRLMVHQPFHGGPKPVEPVTPDPVVETGEQAIKGDRIAGSDSVHRLEEGARVEGMEVQLHLGERRRHTEPSIGEHRPANNARHDQERPAEHGCVRRRRDREGRWVAECRDSVLDNRFQNGTPGIVLYPEQSENQRPGPPFVDGVEPEREDLRVVTARDGHRRLGVLEAGLAELGAEVIEETARQVVHASRGIDPGCAVAIGPPP